MPEKIKGITVEIGGDTQGLKKALSSLNKDINSTQKELNQVNRLLKIDPGNTELLRQKQELLTKSIQDTETKIEALRAAKDKADADMANGTQVNEEQYRQLAREIISSENNLQKMKAEADRTASALKGVDEKPVEEVEAAAKDAEDALEDAGKEASNFGDHLKADFIVEGAKGILSGLKDLAEDTKEYQKIMASLETSSEAAGYSAQETEQSYKQLYGVLGDDQASATTLANLQAIGMSQKDLTDLINGSIGAWARYGDSIPIDSLAESINETIRVGQVTGTFADVLNWAGTSEDDFNKKLESANSETEKANIVMQELANQGLIDAGEAWQKNNEEIVANNQANAELQEQMAELGELVQPIITEVISKVSELLSWFNGLDSSTQTLILGAVALVAAIGPISGAVSGVSSAISFLVSNPIVALVAAIVALVALIATSGDQIQSALQSVDDFLQGIFLTDWTQVFGPGIGDVLNAFMANIKNIWDSIKRIFDGVIDFIRGVFTGDWERAWEGVQNIFGGIFDGLIAVVKAPLNGIIGLMNGMISGINWIIEKINSISVDLPDWLGGGHIGFSLPTIGKIPYLARGGILSQGSAIVGEAGPELLTVSGSRAIVQPLTNQTTNNTASFGNINVYVTASSDDPAQTAREIGEELQAQMQRKGMVFA